MLNDAARAQTQQEIDRLTVEIDAFSKTRPPSAGASRAVAGRVPGEAPAVDALVKELAIGLLFSARETPVRSTSTRPSISPQR